MTGLASIRGGWPVPGSSSRTSFISSRPPAAATTSALLAAGLTVGFAWYLTSRLVAVTHVHDTYPLRVLAIGTGDATVTLTAGPDVAEPGSFRASSPDTRSG